MIILVIHGYISYNIDMNQLIFIKIFIKWYKLNLIRQIKLCGCPARPCPSSYDFALFIWNTDVGTFLIFLYVDDIIITDNDITSIRALQHFLSQNFEMKDLTTLNYFLGLDVTLGADGYYLSQAKYASNLLFRANLTNSKIVSSHLETNVKLIAIDGKPLLDVTLYMQLVGNLIYLTVTRPNISYVVHLIKQFMSAPHSTHYVVVLCILHYVKGLHFSSHSSLELHAYSDADCADDPTDHRSTTD
jgi:hypothetical protein